MDHLLRAHAPISDSGWALLDQEAKERLTHALGARKLVDFAGPHGFEYSATNLGRTDAVVATPSEGVLARRRRVLPVVELRAEFTVARSELRDNDRGAADADLDELRQAAMRMATAENVAVLSGWPEAGIVGVAEACDHEPIRPVSDVNDYPRRVAKAVETLLRCGVDGPYGLAVGPAEYTTITETAEHGGYPLFDHVRQILRGPIVWTPGIDGGVVLSLRGDDFLYESGQDICVGYDSHSADNVRLYLEQTFSFHVATPEAAVALATH